MQQTTLFPNLPEQFNTSTATADLPLFQLAEVKARAAAKNVRYQIAVYDYTSREYLGVVELANESVFAPALFDSLAEAEKFAASLNDYSFFRQYEACEHHEARK